MGKSGTSDSGRLLLDIRMIERKGKYRCVLISKLGQQALRRTEWCDDPVSAVDEARGMIDRDWLEWKGSVKCEV